MNVSEPLARVRRWIASLRVHYWASPEKRESYLVSRARCWKIDGFLWKIFVFLSHPICSCKATACVNQSIRKVLYIDAPLCGSRTCDWCAWGDGCVYEFEELAIGVYICAKETKMCSFFRLCMESCIIGEYIVTDCIIILTLFALSMEVCTLWVYLIFQNICTFFFIIPVYIIHE